MPVSSDKYSAKRLKRDSRTDTSWSGIPPMNKVGASSSPPHADKLRTLEIIAAATTGHLNKRSPLILSPVLPHFAHGKGERNSYCWGPNKRRNDVREVRILTKNSRQQQGRCFSRASYATVQELPPLADRTAHSAGILTKTGSQG